MGPTRRAAAERLVAAEKALRSLDRELRSCQETRTAGRVRPDAPRVERGEAIMCTAGEAVHVLTDSLRNKLMRSRPSLAPYTGN